MLSLASIGYYGCSTPVSLSIPCQSASTVRIASLDALPGSVKLQSACPQAPTHESGSHIGLEDCPFDRMLDAEALKVSSSAHVVPSSIGLGIVLFSLAADSDSVPVETEAGLKGVQVDDGGASYSTLVDPDGAH
ncbi:hypothetical protein Nepgr_027172 [Nepenthes gracilis]|uniref:Uncharacterized protein n=1 Tax=Nepenthes gracilis TaxID=150966 RepID=A0AAD3T9U9_NEPGR|nr:hypothetical protein Nepgr_027172 [Nepenthes gracilis]